MSISKPFKVAIGILTALSILVPFVIMPAFMMFFMFGFAFPLFDTQTPPDPAEIERFVMPMMLIFYPGMICFAFTQLGLQVFYVVHAIKNKALVEAYRILFVLGTFFFPYIAMPIYFFACVWNDAEPDE